jgi:ribonuclease P protein component
MKALKGTFSDISRLNAQAAFDSLRKSKTRWVAQGLVVQVLPRSRPDLSSYGLCISASKKTAPLAVDRNRVRRRLKAIALSVIPTRAKADFDYMISARHQTDARSPAELESDLVWCLKKLELLKEPDAS